jgi:aminoglycoside phosphotransferase (APT) family kinase protein
VEPRLDEASDVRLENPLPLASLVDYLRSRLPGFAEPVELGQFHSGASNLTFLLRAGGREMVLRMPPPGTKARTAHDMAREFRVLAMLRPVFPFCPEAILACDDPSVLGAPFYLMERLRGIILRRDPPPGLDYTPGAARELCIRLLALQTRLHDLGPETLPELGRPAGYVERQVLGWHERYRRARTADAPAGERVMAWLEERRPGDSERPGVVHNDYRLDNVVLDPADAVTIVGVLDWEMATMGDPLLDLGCSLAYWVEEADPPALQALRLQPSHLPGMLTRREMVAEYARLSGRETGDFTFYEVFGLFRLAVIAQQIYFRFAHGETRSQRARSLGGFVPVLVAEAERRIARAS